MKDIQMYIINVSLIIYTILTYENELNWKEYNVLASIKRNTERSKLTNIRYLPRLWMPPRTDPYFSTLS